MSERCQIVIRTEGLGKTFRQGPLVTPVLFDINLAVARGEFVALMGPSGCGKSTLMHILGQMLTPTSGRVIIDGQDTTRLTGSGRAALRRTHIGFVFQRFNLLPTLTARQNLVVAEKLRGNDVDGQIDRALEAVEMSHRAAYKPHQLSIGQQQRIAIARAIAHRPAIIMADEPTGNLDSNHAEQILQLFRRVHREHGITIFMITHSRAAADAAERVIHMADGRLVDSETGAPAREGA